MSTTKTNAYYVSSNSEQLDGPFFDKSEAQKVVSDYWDTLEDQDFLRTLHITTKEMQ